MLKHSKPIRGLDAKAERAAVALKPALLQTIKSEDLVQIFAKDVKLGAEDLSSANEKAEGGFETDSSISRGRG